VNLTVKINVREDEYPRHGQAALRRKLHHAILLAVHEEVSEVDAMLKSIEFIKGKAS
jgi:hypothetical protein